jgi:hypothetical protein
MCPQHTAALARLCSAQIGAALGAPGRTCRVARAAKGTVHVWPGLGKGDLGLIGDQLFLGGLLEFHLFGLRRATIRAGFLWTWVPGAALGTFPF